MSITTEDIKKLRDKTGISVMQCKKALEESEGDQEKALILLQKQSKSIANKKADRALKSGVVSSYIHSNGSVGTLVELACETDFVAKNPEFVSLAREIALHVAAMNPTYVSESEIDDEERSKVKEIMLPEVEDKPEDMKEKILEGKLNSYFNERVLLNQPFVKDEKSTIKDMIEAAVQKFGENTEIIRFARFEVGKE